MIRAREVTFEISIAVLQHIGSYAYSWRYDTVRFVFVNLNNLNTFRWYRERTRLRRRFLNGYQYVQPAC